MADTLTQEVKDKIFKQVEFYFSDSNLPKDNFLKKQIAQNANGYVDLALICSFTRMRDYLKLTTSDPDAIPDSTIKHVADILKQSELVETTEDGLQIRRKKPLGAMDEVSKQIDARSIYARPFPSTATLDDITTFFNKHGTVKCVRLRRHLNSKDFKGSVFVELDTEEEAQRVAALTGLEYEGAGLTLMMKPKYLSMKQDQRKEAKDAADNDSDADAALKRTNGGVTTKGRKRAREDAEGEGEQETADAEAAPAVTPEADSFTEGCLVRWEWADDASVEEVKIFTIKEAVGFDKLRFVEHNRGEKTGIMRFREPTEAAAFVEEAEKQPEEERLLAGFKAQYTLVTGDAEKEYYQRADQKRSELQGKGGNGRGGRGGGRGKFGGRRGRGRFGNKHSRH